jgi:2C-methyl-D-erythritol 2,4-cyclodiphosphate synthase
LAGCKRSEAIEFIKSVYNLQLVQSDWVKQQQQIMIDSANYLDTEEFKTEFPVLSTIIRTRKLHIQKMLMHFTQYVSDDLRVDNKPLFFASLNTLMNVCQIHNKNQMAQSITLFTLLNMLNKVELKDIPEKELNKAKSISAKYGFKKLTNFYSFEEYGVNLLANSEEIAKTLKANNYSLKGLSREYILRTFGMDLANKVYPQYKCENKKGTSKKSDERTLQIVECLFYFIEQKGYATEKEIIYMLSNKYKYQTTELQIKRSLQEILVSYELVRVKASKNNKLKYHIEDNNLSYQSYMICKM